MDLKQLRYFVTIVEEGQITAAAQRLHMAQPPLSHQLKLLEEELGVTLLRRGSRKVTLTDAGKVLYNRAKQLLTLAQSTKKEVGEYTDAMHGTLRMGTISSSAFALLKPELREFVEHNPNIHFEIFEENTFGVIELLQRNLIEIGIVRTPFQTNGLEVIPIQTEPMVAAFQKGFPQGLEGPSIKIQDLDGKPLIYYRRFEKLISSAFHTANIVPRDLCRNDDARTSLLWAAAGMGIALVPQSVLRLVDSTGIESVLLDEPGLTTTVSAIWMKDRYLSEIAGKFLDIFR